LSFKIYKIYKIYKFLKSPMPLGKRKVRFPHAQKPNRPTSSIPMTSAMNPSDSKARPGIPALFTQPPPIRDPLITETIDLQNATLEKCLPFLKGIHSTQKDFNDHGVPALQRDLHISYLYDALEDYPEGFVAMDASRPWIVYWALAGLAMMGEETTRFRERCVQCLHPCFLFSFLFFEVISFPRLVLPPNCFLLSVIYPQDGDRASRSLEEMYLDWKGSSLLYNVKHGKKKEYHSEHSSSSLV
jgi:hypothetical protein